MCRDHSVNRNDRQAGRSPHGHSQRGLGLPTALFVITVMAFLAVSVNQLVQSNAVSSSEATLLIRAFYAAQSGAEIGLSRVFPADGSAGGCAGGSVGFDDAPGLQGCSASFSCSVQTVEDDDYYTLRSTGSCGAVSRTVEVRAR